MNLFSKNLLSPSKLQRASFRSTSFLRAEEKQKPASEVEEEQEEQEEVEATKGDKKEAKKEAKKEEKKEEPKVDEKEQKIKQLENDIVELKSQLTYSLAERENVRRIGKQETEKAREYGIQSFAKSLLDTIDNFQRCISAVKKDQIDQNPALKTLYEGLLMTEKEMLKAFRANGLERFEPVGEKFDPITMNAIQFTPNPSKEPNTVSSVYKPGYTLKGRVIRAVDVEVVKPPIKPAAEEKKEEQAST